jgi:hypothetical protein
VVLDEFLQTRTPRKRFLYILSTLFKKEPRLKERNNIIGFFKLRNRLLKRLKKVVHLDAQVQKAVMNVRTKENGGE